MSQFYGTLQGMRGRATRCGSKSSGIVAQAASWAGAIEVHVYADATGAERFEVRMIPWRGAGDSQTIAAGIVGDARYLRVADSAARLSE